MAKYLLFLSVLTLSFGAFAAPAHLELCALEFNSETEAQFKEEKIFDIKKAKSISKFHLSLINQYYQEDGKTYSFSDLKKLFTNDGDEGYNDLYILKFTSLTSGQVYLEVRTYPGENPVGLVFNAKAGEILATNNDDSYELLTPEGPFSCYQINKDRY